MSYVEADVEEEVTFYNVGYLGDGPYCAHKHTDIFSVWENMLRICYGKVRKEKDLTVVEEWKNFQYFANWYERNYLTGYVMSKDVIQENNKIFGPVWCCFIPFKIDVAMKKKKSKLKQKKIRELAKEFKDELPTHIYEALL